MVSVAEQFSSLRQTLGSVLGIYTLLRWFRTLYAKITGRPPPADAAALTPAAFAAFTNGAALTSSTTIGPDGVPRPKPSKKPFIVFLLAVFGLPYLMGKLIRALAKSQEAAAAQQQLLAPPPPPRTSLDPAKLDFCRVLYDFPPPDARDAADLDLAVAKGDLVAVLDKSDPETGLEAEWWRCRARDGRMGYLPKVYLETIQRRAQITAAAAAVDGRANSMPASVEAGGRAQTLTTERATSLTAAAEMKGKGDDAAKDGRKLVEFQKAWASER